VATADEDRSALGQYIKSQRQLAELSQRELARLCNLSDPYVSQIERGRHDPSIKVLRAIAEALNIRADTILSYAGWLKGEEADDIEHVDAESAIRADQRLSLEQQQALVSTYRAFLASNARTVD
jgi:transcriptional regulator with XRE-family HTH domain